MAKIFGVYGYSSMAPSKLRGVNPLSSVPRDRVLGFESLTEVQKLLTDRCGKNTTVIYHKFSPLLLDIAIVGSLVIGTADRDYISRAISGGTLIVSEEWLEEHDQSKLDTHVLTQDDIEKRYIDKHLVFPNWVTAQDFTGFTYFMFMDMSLIFKRNAIGMPVPDLTQRTINRNLQETFPGWNFANNTLLHVAAKTFIHIKKSESHSGPGWTLLFHLLVGFVLPERPQLFFDQANPLHIKALCKAYSELFNGWKEIPEPYEQPVWEFETEAVEGLLGSAPDIGSLLEWVQNKSA